MTDTNFHSFMGKTVPGMGKRGVATNEFYQTAQTLPKYKKQQNLQKQVTKKAQPNIPRYNDWLGSDIGGHLINSLKLENDTMKEEVF